MEQQQLKTIVLDFPDAARVLEKFGLDFCCGGNDTLVQACAKKNVQWPIVLEALQGVMKTGQERKEYSQQVERLRNLSAGALAKDIIDTHHRFLREHIPYLKELLDKVTRVHGGRHAELQKLQPLVHKTVDTLLVHLDDEEKGLFKMVQEHAADQPLTDQEFRTAQEWIASLEQEHVEVGEQLQQIRDLTQDYQAPADGCGSYRLLYAKLKQLEEDTHLHVHKENYVLFPGVAKLVAATAAASPKMSATAAV